MSTRQNSIIDSRIISHSVKYTVKGTLKPQNKFWMKIRIKSQVLQHD